jgi:hypothetical protein
MKLKFKHQKFQADAAKTVCDVFAGQPYLTPTYMMDKGLLTGGNSINVIIINSQAFNAKGKDAKHSLFTMNTDNCEMSHKIWMQNSKY